MDLPHRTGQNRERCQVLKCWWGIRSHLCSPRAIHPPCGSQRASADTPSTGPRWARGERVAGPIPWRSEEHRHIQRAVSPPHSPTAPSAKGAANVNVKRWDQTAERLTKELLSGWVRRIRLFTYCPFSVLHFVTVILASSLATLRVLPTPQKGKNSCNILASLATRWHHLPPDPG